MADPFGSLHPNGPGGAGAEWDLVLESPATAPTPPVPVDAPPPIPPPVPQRVEAGIGAPPPLAVDPLVTMAQPPAAPVAAAQGLGFDLSGLAAGGASPPPPAYPLLGDSGPLPFQTLAGAAGPAPSETTAGRMPAGEAGSTLIPALKLEVSIGRRVIEQVLQGEALIGRPDSTRGIHPEIDLRLDDAVSRRHAKIFPRNGGYILKDLNSTNGTRFNRRYLQAEEEVALRSGDEIEVGEMTVIRVVEAPSAT
ncbi:MAG: FHA domain-containing protein, partial [Armatimonadetes bacterium]|nr:FHA domain-containing protein [Armatimonadota bacterium]